MKYDDPFIGQRLGPFRVERLLGRGGMASVYLGWDEQLLRPVAIKVLAERYRDDPAFTARFLDEARAVAAWRHPNILQIYSAGEAHDLPYFVMEYMRGLDLAKLLDLYGQAGELIPHADVLGIGRASALDYAHAHGVIHRDVKPANVIVEASGRVVLADFGLARQLSKETLGQVFGSPHYIAPEQARNSADAVPRSDLYSFGVILYEMLSGRPPFDSDSPTGLALQHLHSLPPSPARFNPFLGPEIEAVLLRALSKEPAKRYPNGRALMEALSEALAGSPVPVGSEMDLDEQGTREPGSDSPDSTLAELPQAVPATRRVLSKTRAAELVARYLDEDDFHAHPPTLDYVRPPAEGPDTRASIPGRYEWEGEPVGDIDDSWQEASSWESPPPAASQPRLGRAQLPALLGCGGLLLAVILLAALGLGLVLARGLSPGSRATTGAPVIAPTQADASQVTPSIPRPQQTTPDQPTEAGPPPTGAAAPAGPQELASGNRLALYYNASSLYVKNLSGRDLPISPLAFELLDKDGNPLSTVKGRYWSELYPKFRDGYCLVIKIFGSEGHLDPPECKNRELVVRTPTSDQGNRFWVAQKGSRQEFRVLWNGAEVGRCPVGEGKCTVDLPD